MQQKPAGFRGDWLTPDNPRFKEVIYGGMWNRLVPERLPAIVARVINDDDVMLAVHYARQHKMKAVVRGGGHNWCCPALRNGTLMIDLSQLTGVVSVDAANRRAVTNPIVSNREMQKALEPYGLAYPTGHCPQVKASGYLLSGGMSWNHGVWGSGVGSVETIEMVTADGNLIRASAHENPELFWAARGAGSGFFAVCLRYHLRLYHRPRHITCSSYWFRPELSVQLAEWLGPLADSLSPSVELSQWVVTAPKDLADEFGLTGGRAALITATEFADTPEEAIAHLEPLEKNPFRSECIRRQYAEPATFDNLYDLSGSLWPVGLRSKVDATFSNRPLAGLMSATIDHVLSCPSLKTVYMFAVYTGGEAPSTPPDASFSMTGKIYGGPWSMWDTPEEDAANAAWHERLMDLLKPHIHGHYIAESDTAHHPEYVDMAYLGDSLKRIEEYRAKYDKDGVFVNFHERLP
jgi:hypothetical protein